MKTPMAYSGISLVTAALVATTSTAAVPARARIPFEYTSRWPRRVSWRGRKLSPRLEARQRGEPGEAGVGRQHQDEQRGGLQAQTEDRAGGAGAVHGLADLSQDRGCADLEGHDLGLAGEEGDAEEHHRQPEAHVHQRLPSVLRLGGPERADPVGDRFHPRDGGTAGGVRLGQEEGAGAEQEAAVAGIVTQLETGPGRRGRAQGGRRRGTGPTRTRAAPRRSP